MTEPDRVMARSLLVLLLHPPRLLLRCGVLSSLALMMLG